MLLLLTPGESGDEGRGWGSGKQSVHESDENPGQVSPNAVLAFVHSLWCMWCVLPGVYAAQHCTVRQTCHTCTCNGCKRLQICKGALIMQSTGECTDSAGLVAAFWMPGSLHVSTECPGLEQASCKSAHCTQRQRCTICTASLRCVTSPAQ